MLDRCHCCTKGLVWISTMVNSQVDTLLTIWTLSFMSAMSWGLSLNSGSSRASRRRMQLATRLRSCIGSGARTIRVATLSMGGTSHSNMLSNSCLHVTKSA